MTIPLLFELLGSKVTSIPAFDRKVEARLRREDKICGALGQVLPLVIFLATKQFA